MVERGALVARSMRAGAVTPATQPSDDLVELLRTRSMRAGAVTPATPIACTAHETAPTPLNEGRGCNPGDTFTVGLGVSALIIAQ